MSKEEFASECAPCGSVRPPILTCPNCDNELRGKPAAGIWIAGEPPKDGEKYLVIIRQLYGPAPRKEEYIGPQIIWSAKREVFNPNTEEDEISQDWECDNEEGRVWGDILCWSRINMPTLAIGGKS